MYHEGLGHGGDGDGDGDGGGDLKVAAVGGQVVGHFSNKNKIPKLVCNRSAWCNFFNF